MTDQPRRRGKYAERIRHEGDVPLGDWRQQVVTVMGSDFYLGEVAGGRLFHGSRAALPVGAVLEPGHSRNFRQSPEDSVSFTSSTSTATRWAREYGAGEYFVYEIEPAGDVNVWRAGLADEGRSFTLHEGRASRARIVGVVPRIDNT